MSTTQPIRSKRLLEQFKEYYQEESSMKKDKKKSPCLLMTRAKRKN